MNITRLFDIIEKLAYRNGSYSSVFEDTLSWVIGCFLVKGDPKLAEILKSRYGKDYGLFREFLETLIAFFDANLKEGPCPDFSEKKFNWIDPFGDLYMEISGKHKKSGLGQFFTPATVCDFMAAITIDNSDKKNWINEPCVGSGRMLLAANAVSPGSFFVACDLDAICAKMATLNFLFHGMEAEVCCANGLWARQDWRFGYRINYHLKAFGVPTLLPITKEQSYVYLIEPLQAPKKEEVLELKNSIPANQISVQQLSLF